MKSSTWVGEVSLWGICLSSTNGCEPKFMAGEVKVDLSADVWWLWRMIIPDFTSSRKKNSSTFVRLKLGKGALVSCKYIRQYPSWRNLCMAFLAPCLTGGWNGETIRWRTPTLSLQIFQVKILVRRRSPEKKPVFRSIQSVFGKQCSNILLFRFISCHREG